MSDFPSQQTSYSHCPKCGQQVIGGQFLCGHWPEEYGAHPIGVLDQKPPLGVFEEQRRTDPAQLQLFDWK